MQTLRHGLRQAHRRTTELQEKLNNANAMLAQRPQFDAMTPAQERLAVGFCEEIAGRGDGAGAVLNPVRLLEMAQALYLAEVNAGKPAPPSGPEGVPNAQIGAHGGLPRSDSGPGQEPQHAAAMVGGVSLWYQRALRAERLLASYHAQGVPDAKALVAAAQAVVDRWNSQQWKDLPHTAVYIAKLSEAIATVHVPPAPIDLTPVITWLEGGCDPKEAVKELRLYQERLEAISRPAIGDQAQMRRSG